MASNVEENFQYGDRPPSCICKISIFFIRWPSPESKFAFAYQSSLKITPLVKSPVSSCVSSSPIQILHLSASMALRYSQKQFSIWRLSAISNLQNFDFWSKVGNFFDDWWSKMMIINTQNLFYQLIAWQQWHLLKDHRQRIPRFVIRRYLEKSIQKKLFCHLQFTFTNEDYFPGKKKRL